MDSEKYQMVQDTLLGQAQVAVTLVEAMELDDFVKVAERSLEIGPYADPTAWMRGKERLEKIVEVAKAYRSFAQTKRALDELVLAEQSKG